MARTPPHTPWKMHPDGLPYIICGSDGPSFGPITFAGTRADMMVIATVMHAAPEMLAACKAAREIIADHVAELLRSYCITGANGQPLRDTLNPDEEDAVREKEEALALVDAAIAKAEAA